jgi:hypothetical protein
VWRSLHKVLPGNPATSTRLAAGILISPFAGELMSKREAAAEKDGIIYDRGIQEGQLD